METEFQITTELTESDKLALWGWGADIFQTAPLKIEWRPKQWHLILRDAGGALSKVSILLQQVAVGSASVRVGGIGGVVTAPRAQHHGLARQLMGRSHSFLRTELKVEFGLLFCLDFMLPFYRTLGWVAIEDRVSFEQSDGPRLAVPPLNAMSLALDARPWPAGQVELRSLPW